MALNTESNTQKLFLALFYTLTIEPKDVITMKTFLVLQNMTMMNLLRNTNSDFDSDNVENEPSLKKLASLLLNQY